MPKRARNYLRRVRQRWTDVTAFTVFLAFAVGLSLIVSVFTPAPVHAGNLDRMPTPQKLLDAAILWVFVFIAVRWPLYGGMAAGVVLSMLFAIGSVLQHNLFGIIFWVAFAVEVVASTISGIKNGTLWP